MNKKGSSSTALRIRLLLLAAIAFGLQANAEAQTTQTWLGGDNTWDTGTTADWNGNSVWTGGYDNANFTSTPGTITVSDSGAGGNVTLNTMNFSGAADWLIQGDTIYKHPFSQAAGSSNTTNESTTLLTMNSGVGNVTFTAPISIADIGVNHHLYAFNNSTSTLTIGDVVFTPDTAFPTDTNARSLGFNVNNATGSVVLTGTYTSTDTNGRGSFNFGDGGGNAQANYYLTSTADFTNFNPNSVQGSALNLYAGNLHIATSKFSTIGAQGIGFIGSPDNNQTVDIEGAQTLDLGIYASMKNSGTKATDNVSTYGVAYINQNTADISTWSGNTNLDGTSLTLSAVAGGRLVYSGYIHGDAPLGLTIAGQGTVVLSYSDTVHSNSNTFDERDGNGNLQPTSTVAATLKSGSTTLITNTVGSAFGIASNGSNFYGNAGSHNLPVQIESGAILGGTGISTNPIQPLTATSIIAPGDFGQANLGIAASIGTLHLNGGVVATNGMTLDFKLDGLNSDSIDFGTSTLDWDNLVTINLSGTPVISSANGNGIYKILTGLNLDASTAGANLTFDINAPVGYTVVDFDSVSGARLGNGDDAGQDYFFVQLAAVPEPSTYGLLFLGLLGLLALQRFHRMSA